MKSNRSHPDHPAVRRAASARALLRIGVLLTALAAAACVSACGDIPVQPSDVDFNGTGASHGHP